MTRPRAERRARPRPLPIATGPLLPPAGWPNSAPVSLPTRERVDAMVAPFGHVELQAAAQAIYDAPPSLFDPIVYGVSSALINP